MAASLFALSLCVFSGLVPEWGRWYSSSRHYATQVEAFMRGGLALSDQPFFLEHDLTWSEGGVHQIWGLGIPLWRLPFAAGTKLFGIDEFPDMLAFGMALTLTAWFIFDVFMGRGTAGIASGNPSLPARMASAGGVLILLLFPPFIGLLRSRFEVYEEAVAYEYLFALVLMGLVAEQAVSPARNRYYGMSFLAGLGGLIRPTLFFYGAATLIAGGLALYFGRPVRSIPSRVNADRFRFTPVLLGGLLFSVGGILLFVTNSVRFGSGLEFGHSLSLTPLTGMLYALRFDDPYEQEPFLSALRELFGLLFQVQRFNGTSFYEPGMFAGQSDTLRFRELYLFTYDVSYLLLLTGGAVVGIASGVRLLRSGSPAAPSEDRSARLLILLSLWGGLSTVSLSGFYLRSALISSRYLLDLMPAFAAMVLVVWLALSGMCLRSSSATYLMMSSLIVLAGWMAWQVTRSDCYYGGPKVLTRAEAQRQAMPASGSGRVSLPSEYDVSDDLSRFGIRFNGAGWYEGTGSVMPAVTLFVQDPEFLELELACQETGMSEIDARQVRARIGLENLGRESVARTSQGWSVRFRSPQSPRYQNGVHAVFIAFVPNTGLAAPVTPWRLLKVRWRGQRTLPHHHEE